MKNFVVATLMFILVIFGWVFAYTYTKNVYTELSGEFSSLLETIEAKDWDNSARQLEIIEDKWENAKNRFNLFIDHNSVHNIELGLARTKQFIRKKEHSLSLAEIEVLKKLIHMVKEDESPAINNIL